MVFSSNIFLFAFLPCILVIYYLCKFNRKLSNIVLTVASLGFYAWGEPTFVLVMMSSIVLNWLFGLWVDKVRNDKRKARLAIATMAVFNLGLLGVFKYLMFLMRTVNAIFSANLPIPQIALPIGISFFTFQSISYVVDVYRGKGQVQKSLLNVAMYIAFFPQLIAGPIVRYQTVAEEIEGRRESVEDFAVGCRRFLIGLCKKVILSNNIGIMLETAHGLPGSEMAIATAWIGAFCFMLQVYFDFSGYSDMAIGLGRMFGFHFLENFNYPFIAKRIGEFWRRWHISLVTWFQDYLYFPIGGSRVKTKWRLAFNLFVVWFATGLWHGADETYVLWGVLCYVGILIDRFTPVGSWLEKHHLGTLFTVVYVVATTILVPCVNMPHAITVWKGMFGIECAGLWNDITTLLVKEYGIFFLAGCVCTIPWMPIFKEKLHVPESVIRIVSTAAIIVLTIVSISYIATDSYNPFIYFNF